MDYSVLEKSTLFSGVSAQELRTVLEEIPHHIQCYDKGEIIFHLMEDAARVGIILDCHRDDVPKERPSSADAEERLHSGKFDRGDRNSDLYAAAASGTYVL